MSCTKEITSQEEMTKDGVPMTFNVTVLETKAHKTAWADGDKIYVFFKGLETKYLILERSGSSWINTSGGGTLVDSDFSGLAIKELTAVHFPVAVDVTYADSKFSFTSGGKPVYNYYLFETGKAYTVDGTTVTATLSMGKPANMVQIHVAGIEGNVSDYTFGCSKIKPVACKSVDTDGAITESVLQAGARVSGIADIDGGIFAGRLVYPETAKDYTFTVASNTQIYTLTRASKALTAGKMFNFPALSVTGGSNWAVTDASDLYVDLGLSVKWAKCNVGATTETDYGDYFAWGETTGYNEGKEIFNYNSGHYYFGDYIDKSGSFNKYRYISGYDLTTLEKEDDAAYAALGGKFRMPTKAEVDALIATKSNTTDYTWTWCDGETEKYNGTTIKGWKIVRNSTSATLFLPAAGYFSGASKTNAGTHGYCWSSSLNTNLSQDYNAWTVNYFSTPAKPNTIQTPAYARGYGLSVRPVSE